MAMHEVDVETELKVIIVGNGQVGKTSLLTRFARGEWTDTYKKTIGTDFMEKDVYVNTTGETVKLMLWDTAGQEMFSKLTRNYYRGAGAVVYVFSTVDRESFLEIENWKSKVEAECGNIVSVLVQNKVDLLDQAVVKKVEAEDLARRMGVKLYRTCVKDNILVKDVFEYVTDQFLKRGGAAGMDVNAVADIGDIAQSGSGGAGKKANDPKRANSTSSTNSSTATTGTFKLEPSKRRTNGKKSKFCVLL